MPPKAGGGKKMKDPVYTRVVPSFLKAYSHLLDSSNKKNYLGEELGHDDSPDDFMREAQEETIRAHMEAQAREGKGGNGDDGENDDEEPTPEIVVAPLRPFSREEDGETGTMEGKVGEEEEKEVPAHPDLAGSKGKIIFAASSAGTKKRSGQDAVGATKKARKSLLSFDDSEES